MTTPALGPQRDADFLRRSVEDNLRNLGLDRNSIVNLRMCEPEDDVAAPMEAMRRMRDHSLFGHIGISTVDKEQQQIAPIAALAADGIAYMPTSFRAASRRSRRST